MQSKIRGIHSFCGRQVGGPHSREDVAKHNTEEDCWIIVTDKADDVTKVSYICTLLQDVPG